MSARIVLHAEIATSEEFFDAIKKWLAVAAALGGEEIEKTTAYLVGISQGIETSQKEKETTT